MVGPTSLVPLLFRLVSSGEMLQHKVGEGDAFIGHLAYVSYAKCIRRSGLIG